MQEKDYPHTLIACARDVKWCWVSQRAHSGPKNYFFVNSVTGEVTARCHSAECKGSKSWTGIRPRPKLNDPTAVYDRMSMDLSRFKYINPELGEYKYCDEVVRLMNEWCCKINSAPEPYYLILRFNGGQREYSSYTKRGFQDVFENVRVRVPGEDAKKSIAAIFLKHPLALCFDGSVFNPRPLGDAAGPTSQMFNRFQGIGIPREKASTACTDI